MHSSGIMYLIAVSQLKVTDANDQAQQGAERQRDLLGQSQRLRGVQAYFGLLVR